MLPLLPFVAGVAVGVYAANALRRSDVRENLQRTAKTLFDAAQAFMQRAVGGARSANYGGGRTRPTWTKRANGRMPLPAKPRTRAKTAHAPEPQETVYAIIAGITSWR